VITYEYPLVERIRTMLRLEDLFDRVRFFLDRTDPLEHHVGLLTLFEILEVAGRADLKSDLLQELDRQRAVLAAYRSSADIDQNALAGVLQDIELAHAGLLGMTGKIGQYLRENEWLMGIKQRTSIPGGACEFDLPSYHHWLHRPAEVRLRDLEAWISPLYPIRSGTAIVLKLLRESGKPTNVVAQGGAFQQMLGGRLAQMVRIRIAREADYIPEISANKYMLNVRFVALRDARPRPAETDVGFELTFCTL
jgi:cell division protein ZapD